MTPWTIFRGDPDGPARLPQCFAALSASIGALAIGSVIGYASPATYQLREDFLLSTNDSDGISFDLLPEGVYNETISELSGLEYNYNVSISERMLMSKVESPFTLNKVELSWFSSAFSIGALLGGIASSPALNLIGRRGTMMASALPALVGWILIGFGRHVTPLVVGRLLTGLFTGLTCVSVNTYIGETASSDVRGTLGTSFQLMFSTGIVYSYAFGSFMSWYNLAFLCAALPVLFAILMFFNKESPTFLIAKGREKEAEDALQFLRGKHYDVTKELNELRKAREEASKVKITFADLTRPSISRPLLIMLPLMAFQQFSGINVITFNLATIFKAATSSDFGTQLLSVVAPSVPAVSFLPLPHSTQWKAGTGLSLSMSSILCVVLETLATMIAVFFVDSAGRKALLIISTVIMGISHASLGLFFFMLSIEKEWTLSYLSWLPLVSAIVLMVAYAIGIGPVPWILMGELFPPSVRETAGALATAVNWTMSFLVIFSFEHLQDALVSYGMYWLYAGLCGMAALFSALAVLETKGKTLQQITAMFEEAGSLFAKRCDTIKLTSPLPTSHIQSGPTLPPLLLYKGVPPSDAFTTKSRRCLEMY